MEFADAVRKRRMVRHFKPDPLPTETVDAIMRLVQRAPSGGYTQGQSFVLVTEPETRKALARVCGEEEDRLEDAFRHPWVSEAPVQLVACVSEAAYHRRYQEADKTLPDGSEIVWPVPYWHFDIGASTMILLLAAVDAGLAAGYAGFLDLDAARAILGIPADVTPLGVIPLGYGAEDIPSPSLKRGRRSFEDFLRRERW